MKIKTGYHAVFEKSYFGGIDSAKKYGFEFAQFELGVPTYFLHELSAEKLSKIKKYAEEKGVEITFHAPADNVGLFYDYPLIRRGVLDEFKRILEKANAVGARHMTFHTGNFPMFKETGTKADNTRADYYENILYENLKELTENSGDVLVCVENNGFKPIEIKALQRLIDENVRLYLTLDIAKLYRSEHNILKDDLAFFEKNRERIREIHIHDKNDRFGSHQTVGDGYVDFELFRPFFNADTYLNFEVRPIEAAKKSKDNLFKE